MFLNKLSCKIAVLKLPHHSSFDIKPTNILSIRYNFCLISANPQITKATLCSARNSFISQLQWQAVQ
ncbi:MAG: hypothetical protein ACI945_001519 [Pseudohongiellaceae bacterium]|jgi:hypothetical protein